MDYKLAKELKDAGFPLSMSGFDDYCRQVYMPDSESVQRHEDRYAYEPSLSELIEACEPYRRFFVGETGGYEHAGMCINYTGKDNKSYNDHLYWEASYAYFDYPSGAINGNLPKFNGRGSTPEEAVARLWIALNKKS